MFAAKGDALLRRTAASAISFYQHRISPFKGFSCAHRVLHGGDSCSQFVKDLVVEIGPYAAVAPARVRLASCRGANEALQAEAFWPSTRRDRRRRGRGRWSRRRRRVDLDEASETFEDSPDTSGCGPDSVDCGSCDCLP